MSTQVRWTEADVQMALKRRSRTKYGAKRVQIDGIWFDSKAEGRRYTELKFMEAAGLISDLKCHPVFPIDYNGQHVCDVELDFSYFDTVVKVTRYEDCKGVDNPLSALKRKLVKAFHGIDVELVR